MHGKKSLAGYTLLEILIIIVLIAIFSAGFLSFFMGILRTERQARFLVKSEADVSALRTTLRKELQSIGFGISADYLRVNPESCDDTSVISGNSTYLCYLSLASRQTKWAGCWWIVDGTGNPINSTSAKNRFGGNCSPPPRRKNCIFLDSNRINLGISNCNNTASYPSTVSFYLDGNYPRDFRVKLYLKSDSTPDKFCHPDLQNQTLQLETKDNNQPLVSCVYDLKILFIDKQGQPQTSLPTSLQDLSGLRVCLIVQAGSRGSIRYEFPQYSERCGETPLPSDDSYYFYPFKVIEEEISLPNLRGWALQ